MKREKVKKILYEARLKMIDELDEFERHPGEGFCRSKGIKECDFDYGYKVGISAAAMILLDVIEKYFPEEKDEDTDE